MRWPIGPEGPARYPVRSQSFVVTHSVLNDKSSYPFRMCQYHAEAHRAAVVLHVKCVAGEAKRLREIIDDASDVVEGIRELFGVGPVAVAEAGIVGGDQVDLVGEA